VQGMVTIAWDLTKPLFERRMNEDVVVKPISVDELKEVGKILVVTWEASSRARKSLKGG